MSANKSRILYIKRFLEENTDENHPATIADIVNYLSGKGIPASRQTVAREIEEPTDAGMDIICTAGRPGGYFVGGRLFELPELKLLIDAAHKASVLKEASNSWRAAALL